MRDARTTADRAARDARIKELAGRGLWESQIAAALGVRKATIRARAKALGLTLATRNFDWTPEAEARITALFERGYWAAAAAREVGCNVAAARERLRRFRGLKAGERPPAGVGAGGGVLVPRVPTRYGLPPTLPTKWVEVLLALTTGPAAKGEVADATGRPAAEVGKALIELRAKGLVAAIGSGPVWRWFLTPLAMDMMEGAACRPA